VTDDKIRQALAWIRSARSGSCVLWSVARSFEVVGSRAAVTLHVVLEPLTACHERGFLGVFEKVARLLQREVSQRC
jgi:hypothetical protein